MRNSQYNYQALCSEQKILTKYTKKQTKILKIQKLQCLFIGQNESTQFENCITFSNCHYKYLIKISSLHNRLSLYYKK